MHGILVVFYMPRESRSFTSSMVSSPLSAKAEGELPCNSHRDAQHICHQAIRCCVAADACGADTLTTLYKAPAEGERIADRWWRGVPVSSSRLSSPSHSPSFLVAVIDSVAAPSITPHQSARRTSTHIPSHATPNP